MLKTELYLATFEKGPAPVNMIQPRVNPATHAWAVWFHGKLYRHGFAESEEAAHTTARLYIPKGGLRNTANKKVESILDRLYGGAQGYTDWLQEIRRHHAIEVTPVQKITI